jgi:hypothetical protein
MGTRSDIIVHRTDGRWHRIYCHWDGYLEHNGKILFDHYTSQKHVEALVALGDLSSLAPKIGRKHPFQRPSASNYVDGKHVDNPAYAKFVKTYGDMCTAYGRDRGEKNVAGTIGDNLFAVWPEQETWTEFTYVWCDADIAERPRDPCWWVGNPDKGTQDLVNLGDALQGKITVCPSVKAFGLTLGQHNPLDPFKPTHAWSSKA